ncbi:hypothetical protein BB560_003542 [Smittium megazygosporum]|uniref:Transcription initiation factor TFIID subunit 11 n=1 Tax=Smittium megazygosporum TaxID=133381 RepID=A0A2T9ZBQ5_9FUNG|nr:hypothetical protein BB560_003542 [Smittium megazygosporum]
MDASKSSSQKSEKSKPEQSQKKDPGPAKSNAMPLALGLAGFRNSIKSKVGQRGITSKSFFVKNTKTITLTGIAPSPLVSKKRIRFIDRPSGKANALNYEVYEPKKKSRRTSNQISSIPNSSSNVSKNNSKKAIEQQAPQTSISNPPSILKESHKPATGNLNIDSASVPKKEDFPKVSSQIGANAPENSSLSLQANNLEAADEAAEDQEDAELKNYVYSIEDQYNIKRQSKFEIKRLIDSFNDDERQRYEIYRRTALSKSSIKKLVSSILNQQISQTLSFVIAGFGKVFVGEIVELALSVMDELGETGPIQPHHLREAYQRYLNK